MDLNKLIPNNDSNWSISGKFVMFKKLQKIPVCVFENGIIYVFLENKISNQILKFTKNLLRLKYEFYFTTPLYSNPSGVDNLKEEVINSYLYSYTNETFFYGLKKIGFDLIKNMVDWCVLNNCVDLLKKQHDKINKEVQRHFYDYYSKKNYYEFKNKEIRDEFLTLWRDIQINRIL